MPNKDFRKFQRTLGIALCIVAIIFFVICLSFAKGYEPKYAATIGTILITIVPGIPGLLLLRSRRKALRKMEEDYIKAAQEYNPNKSNDDIDMEAGRLVLVKCPNCGATNKVPEHSIGKCEYCGSPIEDKN